MSGPDQLNGIVTDPIQVRFGVPASTQAPEVERRQWEQLCRELLQEREQLRAELAETKAKCERYLLYLRADSEARFTPEMEEEMFAQLDQLPSLRDILNELANEQPPEPGGP